MLVLYVILPYLYTIIKNKEIMKTYTNTVIINGEKFTNTVKAYSYKEALAIQKDRKVKSNNKFEGHLALS